jgi:GT2 family glycosyltransferase
MQSHLYLEKTPVIILNWNGIDDTIECVESVLKQSFQDFVIYLVDNCSENQEFERLYEKYHDNSQIELLKNEINLGFTLANNQIFEKLKVSGTEFIALINNDAVADSSWLEKALKTAKEQKAQIVACKMINYFDREKPDSEGLILLSSGEILPSCHYFNVNSTSKPVNIIAASGGACLYQIEMLNQIGFFDPYFSTGYEDAELGLRAFMSGYKIAYEAKSIVYHKISRSVLKIIDQKRVQKIQEDINYTYFKLMPTTVILINAMINIPRKIIIVLIHLFLFRFKFIKCQLLAIVRTFHDRNIILSERAKFRKIRKLNSCEIMKAQHFSLVYDFKRFNRYVIGGRKNQFEKY